MLLSVPSTLVGRVELDRYGAVFGRWPRKATGGEWYEADRRSNSLVPRFRDSRRPVPGTGYR